MSTRTATRPSASTPRMLCVCFERWGVLCHDRRLRRFFLFWHR